MPRRAYQERHFDPAKPVIVRRAFTGGGRHWRPGDTFDWQKLAVDRRRVRQLFDAGKLRHDDRPDEIDQTGDVSEPLPAEKVSEGTGEPTPDDLDAIDDMKTLRRIAVEEGAPFRVSKMQQRKAIRDHRNA